MKAANIDVMIKMMTGDYEKSEHIHRCDKCGTVWPHDVADCQWPHPWFCPDCEK